MMTEKLKQTIKGEMARLPNDAQEAINAFDWVKISEEIGKKYLLTENEITFFQAEIGLTLVGLSDPNYFAQNVENEVGTGRDEARKMADEVFQRILTPIANIAIEKIKKNLNNKKPDWRQTLHFVLSGGDYFAFAERRENPNAPENVLRLPVSGIAKSRITDLKSKFTI